MIELIPIEGLYGNWLIKEQIWKRWGLDCEILDK